MKRLNIHTSNYKSELTGFKKVLEKNNLCLVQPYTGGISLAWESLANDMVIDALLLMLQSIVMHENPVYRHSPKLRDLANSIKDTELHIHELQLLKAFIRANKNIHLDGYAAFRMEAYREKLDMMLYRIVKKIKSGK